MSTHPVDVRQNHFCRTEGNEKTARPETNVTYGVTIANRVRSVGKVPFVRREVDTFRRGQTLLLSDSVILSILALVYFQQGGTKTM